MGRLISLIISIIYLVTAYMIDGGETGLKMLAFLILPLACIWLGDELGSFTGSTLQGVGRSVSTATPGCLVRFIGWGLLLSPVIIGIISSITENSN